MKKIVISFLVFFFCLATLNAQNTESKKKKDEACSMFESFFKKDKSVSTNGAKNQSLLTSKEIIGKDFFKLFASAKTKNLVQKNIKTGKNVYQELLFKTPEGVTLTYVYNKGLGETWAYLRIVRPFLLPVVSFEFKKNNSTIKNLNIGPRGSELIRITFYKARNEKGMDKLIKALNITLPTDAEAKSIIEKQAKDPTGESEFFRQLLGEASSLSVWKNVVTEPERDPLETLMDAWQEIALYAMAAKNQKARDKMQYDYLNNLTYPESIKKACSGELTNQEYLNFVYGRSGYGAYGYDGEYYGGGGYDGYGKIPADETFVKQVDEVDGKKFSSVSYTANGIQYRLYDNGMFFGVNETTDKSLPVLTKTQFIDLLKKQATQGSDLDVFVNKELKELE